MTLAWFSGNQITGTSLDRTGGTWTTLPVGYKFLETDTFFSYYWNGSSWNSLLGTTSGDSTPAVYDAFASTYAITTDSGSGTGSAPCNTLTSNSLWRCIYRGINPSNGADTGSIGVRVPSVLPPDSSPRVFYAQAYANTCAINDTDANLTLTEGPYYTDIDITFYMRTKAQRKTTFVKNWETAWFMWRFNQAGYQITQPGAHFHHYYVLLKTNGHIELGKKDRDDFVDAQRFLTGSSAQEPTFTWALNTWYKIRIRHVGNHVQMWLDDVLKVDKTDDGTLTDNAGTIPVPSANIGSGRFGLYCEDAEAEWSPMTLTTIGTGTSSAPSNTPYLTLSTDGTLTGERVLAVGSSKLSKTDGGAGGSLTLDAVEANFSITNMNTTLADAKNIALGTSSGTKIGTATNQKLGFFNATPIVQPAANADTSGVNVANLEIEVNQLKATLRSLGLLAP